MTLEEKKAALEAAEKTYEDRAVAIDEYQGTDFADVTIEDSEEKAFNEGVAFGLRLGMKVLSDESIANMHAEPFTHE